MFDEAKDPNIFDDLLIMSKQQGKNKLIQIFGMDQILNSSNYLFHTDFGQVCTNQKNCDLCSDQSLNKLVGINHGLPINLRLTKKPNLLFEVLTSSDAIGYGGFPYHYYYSSPNAKGVFKLASFATNKIVPNSTITFEPFYDSNQIFFHFDNSERLVVVALHEMIIYKLSCEGLIQDLKFPMNPHVLNLSKNNSRRDPRLRTIAIKRTYANIEVNINILIF